MSGPNEISAVSGTPSNQGGEKDVTAVVSDDADNERWLAAEKSLTRKLDLTLVPMAWLLFVFNYLDRNGMAQAKLSTLENDLELEGMEFHAAVSILNVGYFLVQLPSNMIITRCRPSVFLGCAALVWSCVSLTTAFARNFRDLVVIRLLLGVAEAPFFPGAMFLLACWYPRHQLAVRTAILHSALILSTAFSGLISAGVFARMTGVLGLSGWRWLFIVEGAGGFLAGLLALVLLPDFIDQRQMGFTKWLLTDREMEVAARRMERDRVSLPDAKRSAWVGLKLTVMDVRTWIFALMAMASHAAYGFNNFFPTMVKGLGIGGSTLTLALTAPPYVVSTVATLCIAYSSDKRSERGWHVAAPQALAVVGFILATAVDLAPVRYLAAFFYTTGTFASTAVMLSWIGATFGRTPETRACAMALVNLIGQCGNIYSPYFFPNAQAPRYRMACVLMLAFSLLCIATSIVMKRVLVRANRKLQSSSGGADVTLFML